MHPDAFAVEDMNRLVPQSRKAKAGYFSQIVVYRQSGEMIENRVQAGVCPTMKFADTVDGEHRPLLNRSRQSEEALAFSKLSLWLVLKPVIFQAIEKQNAEGLRPSLSAHVSWREHGAPVKTAAGFVSSARDGIRHRSSDLESLCSRFAYSRSNRVCESPNCSSFTPKRSISDRYKLHILRLSSLSFR